MSMNTDFGTSADRLDFRNAWVRGLMRSAWALISGKRTDLVSWDELFENFRPSSQTSRGIQTVPIEKIVGSVGRYHDFDDAFLPRNSHLTDRWARVNRAYNADVYLPPIKLYQVGEVYFVIDGHHRVSVARQHDVAYIDADVIEAKLRVPLTEADVDARNFDLLGELDTFMTRTHLNELRPDADVRFSIAGGHERLLDHIAKHRYFMGLDLKRDVTFAESVISWYDSVYLPLVQVIRKENALAKFKDRTEADMYLWISEHRWYLSESCDDCDVPAQDAAHNFAETFSPKSTLERVVERVGDAISEVAGALFPGGDPVAQRGGQDPHLTEIARPKAPTPPAA